MRLVVAADDATVGSPARLECALLAGSLNITEAKRFALAKGNGPEIAFRTVPAPIGAAKLAAAAPLRCLRFSPAQAPVEAAAEAAVEAVADMRPSPGSPSHPGTSASPVAAAEAEAAEAAAEAAEPRSCR